MDKNVINMKNKTVKYAFKIKDNEMMDLTIIF